jgi:hypothetical protein
VRLPRPIQSAIDWLRFELPRRLPKGRPHLPRNLSLPSDVRLPHLQPRVALGLAGAALALALAWAIADGPLSGDDDKPEVETKVVTVAVETDDASEAPVGPLGFPLVATRNTTRVGGPDPESDAAAVALATHPRAPGTDPVEAAVLVDGGSPYAGIAASVLAGPPLRAPILIGGSDGVPVPTADALAKLNPRGGSGPGDAAVYRVGDVAAPAGYQSEQAGSGSPAEIANAVDQLRAKVAGAEPQHVVVASSDEPAYAMPAAAWAARSGDPVLFTGREEVPEATLAALRRHKGARVYVLGPPSVISEQAVRGLERVSPGVQRVGAEGPVANAVAFARFSDQTFGWDINLPGHGLVLANTARPLDAAAGATLSASGKWGPLLLLDSASTLPPELQSFLLDIKPGYVDDPTAAVYNHVWLLGDASAIGARVQAQIDEIAELAEVGPGVGGPAGPAGTTLPGQQGPADDEVPPDKLGGGARP